MSADKIGPFDFLPCMKAQPFLLRWQPADWILALTVKLATGAPSTLYRKHPSVLNAYAACIKALLDNDPSQLLGTLQLCMRSSSVDSHRSVCHLLAYAAQVIMMAIMIKLAEPTQVL